MPDYECPSCGGGFPAVACDDGCPWCGESMAGDESSQVTIPGTDATVTVPQDGINPFEIFDPRRSRVDFDDPLDGGPNTQARTFAERREADQ